MSSPAEPSPKKPIIFSYTNYRSYTKDYFSWRKKKDNFFSHAYFAAKAGFKSRSFILKVINGEKSLARKRIFSVITAMQLSKKEGEYFGALVSFNESKNLEEKNFYFKQLQSVHKSHSSVKFREDQYQFFYNWFNAPVRELVTFNKFNGDYKALGKAVFPSISAKDAKTSVELLLRLKMIEKEKDRFIQTDKVITTGDEVQSLAVQNFQKENLKLAIHSLEELSESKEISTLTFGTSKDGFEDVKKEIIEFRKQLIQQIIEQKNLDRVYQLNFQLFPLSASENGAVK